MSHEDAFKEATEKLARLMARRLTGTVVLEIKVNEGGICSMEVTVTEKSKIK